MIYNKDEEHTKSMNAPTLSTLWDQSRFYTMLEQGKFSWLSKAYKSNTGLDPQDTYHGVLRMIYLRIIASFILSVVIIGFFFLLHKECVRLNWLTRDDFQFCTIGCIMSIVAYWVMESKAIDAIVALEWKTYTFLDEVYDIIPDGQSYKGERCFEALTGTVSEIHREDVPEALRKSHSTRLIKEALEIIDLEGAGKKKGLPNAVRRDTMKAGLRKLHTAGKKFGLCLANTDEGIDVVYDAAKKSRA